MKNKTPIIIALLLIILFMFGILQHSNFKSDAENVTVDTIVRYDTVYNTIFKVVEKPVLRRVETIKYDTVYQSSDTVISLPIEQKTYQDTIPCEADTVLIESTIVGIKPSLESLKVRLLRREIHQQSEIIINKKVKDKGFYIAPNASIGYGVFNKKPDLYVGVGVGYKF